MMKYVTGFGGLLLGGIIGAFWAFQTFLRWQEESLEKLRRKYNSPSVVARKYGPKRQGRG